MGTEAISFDQRVKNISDKLDKKLKEKHLNFLADDSEIDEIFALGIDELGKLNPQKLSEYSFLLSKYNIYLRKELNKELAEVGWAKKCMDFMIMPIMMDYRVPQSYMSNDEVKIRAIKDNDVATKFYSYIVEKEQSITLISDLSLDIRKMSEQLENISKSKRYNNA